MGKLKGKVAIITGASGGLGKFISIKFAEEGAMLALCDLNKERLKETVELCESKGASVIALNCDVSSKEQMEAFVSATVAKFGTIDILINMAMAIKPPHSFLDHDLEDLDLSYRTGLVSTWIMMKLSYPHLRTKGGKIINFSSGAGYLGEEGYASYAAIKEGIRGLSRVVAREWGPENINVNVVNPGALTEGVKNYMNTLPEEQRDLRLLGFRDTPLRRFGDAYEDIAPVVVFLASEDSRHITGQTFFVDGGAIINA
ncbi:SDR family oxidoreductase [Paenibacillus albidus]|uniref:SDR family NAD(P)-dependent oxidoreductase n=1 Tax=Paenibacillus albidus TaxID=2041023 RepID=UPI001BE85645|nr:SDR family oxidoreductase [Paenibacillus albidus]MBT2293135.1 SDR family oxidoreductase [Paenibacillus albidus]